MVVCFTEVEEPIFSKFFSFDRRRPVTVEMEISVLSSAPALGSAFFVVERCDGV